MTDVGRRVCTVLQHKERCIEMLLVDACSFARLAGQEAVQQMQACSAALPLSPQPSPVLRWCPTGAQVPFDSFMQLEAERLTGQALVGTQLWQYRFDIPAGAKEGAGTWQPALVVGFDASTGEHEVRMGSMTLSWHDVPAWPALL